VASARHVGGPLACLFAGALLVPIGARAEVRRVSVESRADVLDGRSFGPAGPYEKLAGWIHFAFDPTHPANARIVDLDRALRGADGRVAVSATFMVLRPKDPSRGRGVALVDVSNRGDKAVLGLFNRGSFAVNPTVPTDFGDGLLLRQGLTLVWVGWEFDVPPGDGALRLEAPVATDHDRPIEGLVRSDWTVDRPLTTLSLGHHHLRAYPVSDPSASDAVLTVRGGRLAPRTVLPRERWRFAREVDGRVVPDREHIFMAGGFEAGRIYELVYRAANPPVVGLGLAVVRDVIAYAKYDERSLFPARLGIAFGVSQTGRFLRHFLYQGFNTDEHGRQAFDGMLIHAAGAGRGSFNHRFAQPSRDAHRYSAFFYPTDLFPFTSRVERDPVTGLTDGLAAHEHLDHLPKIFSTNSGYEYWGRAASLISTTPDGGRDVDPMPNERLYHLAGGQHFVGGFPPAPETRLPGARAFRGDPLDYVPTLRALLCRLIGWVADGLEPPPSAYPRIDTATLTPVSGLRFPAIPGVEAPRVAHEAYHVDYGPRWSQGIITVEPPRLGPPFPTLVPQVDPMGNELGGLRGVELLAPVATYAPWSLRWGYPAATDELVDFVGTWIPFPATEVAREAAGDPRPSLEALYGDRARYLSAARAAATTLVGRGLLLDEDVGSVLARVEREWEWVTGN
jgi:alpha/beta hydrolase family protein